MRSLGLNTSRHILCSSWSVVDSSLAKNYTYNYRRSNIFHERNYHKATLESVIGSRILWRRGKKPAILPLDHRDLWREIGRIFSTGSFWSGSMIVMRNADDSETPARNKKGLGGCWFLRCWGVLCAFFVRVLAWVFGRRLKSWWIKCRWSWNAKQWDILAGTFSDMIR